MACGRDLMSNVKRKNGSRIIVILLLAVTLLLAVISCFLALRLYRRSDPLLPGRWRMQIDYTELVRQRANVWLCNAQLGDQFDTGRYLPHLPLYVDLYLNRDGSWSRSVDAASLLSAKAAAERALASALCDLLCLRISDAGRPAGTAAEAASLIEETIGMSAEQYLAGYGPSMLPSAEEFSSLYSGSGTYRIEGSLIYFDSRPAMHYLADDSFLLISDGEQTEVYARAA